MSKNYPYLRDPRVISEIRKHQWIESEKSGREIGFGSAAIDWINKYAEQWKAAHAEKGLQKSVFFEQRRYRRFNFQTHAFLIYQDTAFELKTIDVSYLGLLCRMKKQVPAGSNVIIQWSFQPDGKSGVALEATVERALEDHKSQGEFITLLKFSEYARKKIWGFFGL